MVAKAITQNGQDEQAQNTPVAPPQRTTGNKLFDLLVYPSIAFGAVFAFSVWMLHTTKFGSGAAHDGFKSLVKSTADWFGKLSVFKGQSQEQLTKKADNYISVLVSFFAGTLLIAPIKIFEDYRGKISHKIDEYLNSVPKDKSAYDQEPRQSWGSVFGGRAITFGLVLGLATVAGKNINAGAQRVARKIASTWGKWHPSSRVELKKVEEWSFVSAFEGFYTALCAALIYVFSRNLARKFNEEEKQVPSPPETLTENVRPAVPETDLAKSASHAARENARQQTAAATLTSLAL